MYITNYHNIIAAVQFCGFERTPEGPVIFYGDFEVEVMHGNTKFL